MVAAYAMAPPEPRGRMTVRTARIVVTVAGFGAARTAVEKLAESHGGFLLELKVTSPNDGTQVLTVLLRVPAERMETVLQELRQMGRILEESQTQQDVTEQHGDLVARLRNARHMEQRLLDVLRQHTGKVAEILEAEQEIARVRGEIESMERQQQRLERQAQYAEIQVEVREEYNARLQTAETPAERRFQNALVEGGRNVLSTLAEAGLFLLRFGPALLLWSAALFWPTRAAWRRVRARAH